MDMAEEGESLLGSQNGDFTEGLNGGEQPSEGAKTEKKGQDNQLAANLTEDEEDTQEYDEEYEEEMSTPLYLVSSIFFLIGCLFYTMSAILWYRYPKPTAEQNFIITCVEGMGAISYLIEPVVDFADVLIRVNWARRRNPDMKCGEVMCEDPMGLAAAFFFFVASSFYFWANVLSLVMIYNRESNPRGPASNWSAPAPAPTYDGSHGHTTVFDADATTTWDSLAPGPAPSPKWERSQTDVLNDVAAGIFLFDSAIGLVALWQRRRADKGTENERRIICCTSWRDCDFSWWGDWFFFFGAIMECMDLSTWYDPAKNMGACWLWTADAILYILDYYSWSEVECCQLKMIPVERRRSSSLSRLSFKDNLETPLLGTLTTIAETNEEDLTMTIGDDDIDDEESPVS